MRGLTDEELATGWKLYTELHGFAGQAEARIATKETAAAQAINEIDAWARPPSLQLERCSKRAS